MQQKKKDQTFFHFLKRSERGLSPEFNMIDQPPPGRCLGPEGLLPGNRIGWPAGADEGRVIGPPGLFFGTLPSGRLESEAPFPLAGFAAPSPSTLGPTAPGIELLLEALDIPIFFPLPLVLLEIGLVAGSVWAKAIPEKERKASRNRILVMSLMDFHFRN